MIQGIWKEPHLHEPRINLSNLSDLHQSNAHNPHVEADAFNWSPTPTLRYYRSLHSIRTDNSNEPARHCCYKIEYFKVD